MQNHFTGKLYRGEEIAIAKIKQTNFEVIDKMIEIIQIQTTYYAIFVLKSYLKLKHYQNYQLLRSW